MKKVLCLVIAVLITVTMACSVFATGSKTDGDFIPSISYADHPTNVPYEGVEAFRCVFRTYLRFRVQAVYEKRG